MGDIYLRFRNILTLMSLNQVYWLYFVNAVLLIVHEIDSAYWEEWKLFRLPGGNQGFNLMHIPLVALILYGLVELNYGRYHGIIMSLVLSLGGLFAFTIHTYFMRKGGEEFQTPVSRGILYSILFVSTVQLFMTLSFLV